MSALLLVGSTLLSKTDGLKLSPVQKQIQKVDLSLESNLLDTTFTEVYSYFYDERLKTPSNVTTDIDTSKNLSYINKLKSLVERWTTLKEKLRSSTPSSSSSSFVKAMRDIEKSLMNNKALLGQLYMLSDEKELALEQFEPSCKSLFKLETILKSPYIDGWIDCYASLGQLYLELRMYDKRHELETVLSNNLPWLYSIVKSVTTESSMTSSDNSVASIDNTTDILTALWKLNTVDRLCIADQSRRMWQFMRHIRMKLEEAIYDFLSATSERQQLSVFITAQDMIESELNKYSNSASSILMVTEMILKSNDITTATTALDMTNIHKDITQINSQQMYDENNENSMQDLSASIKPWMSDLLKELKQYVYREVSIYLHYMDLILDKGVTNLPNIHECDAHIPDITATSLDSIVPLGFQSKDIIRSMYIETYLMIQSTTTVTTTVNSQYTNHETKPSQEEISVDNKDDKNSYKKHTTSSDTTNSNKGKRTYSSTSRNNKFSNNQNRNTKQSSFSSSTSFSSMSSKSSSSSDQSFHHHHNNNHNNDNHSNDNKKRQQHTTNKSNEHHQYTHTHTHSLFFQKGYYTKWLILIFCIGSYIVCQTAHIREELLKQKYIHNIVDFIIMICTKVMATMVILYECIYTVITGKPAPRQLDKHTIATNNNNNTSSTSNSNSTNGKSKKILNASNPYLHQPSYTASNATHTTNKALTGVLRYFNDYDEKGLYITNGKSSKNSTTNSTSNSSIHTIANINKRRHSASSTHSSVTTISRNSSQQDSIIDDLVHEIENMNKGQLKQSNKSTSQNNNNTSSKKKKKSNSMKSIATPRMNETSIPSATNNDLNSTATSTGSVSHIPPTSTSSSSLIVDDKSRPNISSNPPVNHISLDDYIWEEDDQNILKLVQAVEDEWVECTKKKSNKAQKQATVPVISTCSTANTSRCTVDVENVMATMTRTTTATTATVDTTMSSYESLDTSVPSHSLTDDMNIPPKDSTDMCNLAPIHSYTETKTSSSQRRADDIRQRRIEEYRIKQFFEHKRLQDEANKTKEILMKQKQIAVANQDIRRASGPKSTNKAKETNTSVIKDSSANDEVKGYNKKLTPRRAIQTTSKSTATSSKLQQYNTQQQVQSTHDLIDINHKGLSSSVNLTDIESDSMDSDSLSTVTSGSHNHHHHSMSSQDHSDNNHNTIEKDHHHHIIPHIMYSSSSSSSSPRVRTQSQHTTSSAGAHESVNMTVDEEKKVEIHIAPNSVQLQPLSSYERSSSSMRILQQVKNSPLSPRCMTHTNISPTVLMKAGNNSNNSPLNNGMNTDSSITKEEERIDSQVPTVTDSHMIYNTGYTLINPDGTYTALTANDIQQIYSPIYHPHMLSVPPTPAPVPLISTTPQGTFLTIDPQYMQTYSHMMPSPDMIPIHVTTPPSTIPMVPMVPMMMPHTPTDHQQVPTAYYIYPNGTMMPVPDYPLNSVPPPPPTTSIPYDYSANMNMLSSYQVTSPTNAIDTQQNIGSAGTWATTPTHIVSPEIDIMEAVRKQIEYYFSVENLCRDAYLRNKMDNEGFVDLYEISTFRRIQQLQPTAEQIVEAVLESSCLRIKESYTVHLARRNSLPLTSLSDTDLLSTKVGSIYPRELWDHEPNMIRQQSPTYLINTTPVVPLTSPNNATTTTM